MRNFKKSGARSPFDMLGVFAEFETNLRKERQAEGIAKAKAAGVYKGRPPSTDVMKVRALKKAWVPPKSQKRSTLDVHRFIGRLMRDKGRRLTVR